MTPSRPWTSADLRRVEDAARGVWLELTDSLSLRGERAAVARIAELLRGPSGRALVIEALALATSPEYLPGRAHLARECRAAARLRDRVAAEGLPAGAVLPWAPEDEPAEAAPSSDPVAVLGTNEAQRREIDRAQVERALAALPSSGEVVVARGDSAPFGSEYLTWDELSPVDWRAFVFADAARICKGGLTIDAWLRATSKPSADWPAPGRRLVVDAWACALGRVARGGAPWPRVLDLRGLPGRHGMPEAAFVEPLAAALRERPSGVVLVVDEGGQALARSLPAGGLEQPRAS